MYAGTKMFSYHVSKVHACVCNKRTYIMCTAATLKMHKIKHLVQEGFGHSLPKSTAGNVMHSPSTPTSRIHSCAYSHESITFDKKKSLPQYKSWSPCHKSSVSSYSTQKQDLVYQELTSRTLVKLEGADTFPFLQGLVTNDVLHLQGYQRSLYTLLLNVQGRVLYDMILYNLNKKEEPSLLAECDKEVASEILSIFKRYKIRKKVKLSQCGDEYRLWVALPGDIQGSPVSPQSDDASIVFSQKDPRVTALGYRIITRPDVKDGFLDNATTVQDDSFYRRRRYELGVGEGTQDLPPGNCFPLESNAVFLNGVSFNKGCYIGQELTARTYHTGVTRKRLMPLHFSSNIGVSTEDKVESVAGKSGGKIRGITGNTGLGLLRLANVLDKGKPQQLIMKSASSGDETGRGQTVVPPWWHIEHDEYLRSVFALPTPS